MAEWGGLIRMYPVKECSFFPMWFCPSEGLHQQNRPPFLYCKRNNWIQQVSMEDKRGRSQPRFCLLSLSSLKKHAFCCAPPCLILGITQYHLWLMRIPPNSAFEMRKSTCKQIKATLSRVSFIRNEKEFWTHFPDLSQLVQTHGGKKKKKKGIYQEISNSII